MAWLGTWKYRVKADIDYTNGIGGSVTQFPLTIFINSAAGKGDKDLTPIFDEVGSNYQKIAVTKSDGTTQLYVEVEQWDATNKKAVLHVSKSDWTISSDTYVYLYFDNSQPNNTTYIGTIGSSAGQAVWDSYYKAVYHMVDYDTSTVKDSTSNNNTGNKKGSNEPIETSSGKIGKAQSFDGSDDYIKVSDTDILALGDFTISAWIKGTGTSKYIYNDYEQTSKGKHIQFWIDSNGKIRIQFRVINSDSCYAINSDSVVNDNNWYYVAGVRNDTDLLIYRNLVSKTLGSCATGVINTTDDKYIGCSHVNSLGEYFSGIIDELRISAVARSTAWIKGEYNSLFDTLLTWGDIENFSYTTVALKSTLEAQQKTTAALKSTLEAQQKTTLAVSATLDIFGETILISPEHETFGSSPVTFVWKIPTLSTNEPLHAHLQVDKTSNAFGDLEVDLYSYKDSGFEYWDGSQWQPWPATGVPSTYYGNNGRITVNLTLGTKYWRVRHGREIS